MKAKKVVMGFAVAAFLLMILFPLWGWVFPQPAFGSLNEKRLLTELDQSGTLRDRINNFEEYLDDHLAFRNAAIYATLRADLSLGESPSPQVLAGSDGWLYFVDGDEDFRRGTGLTQEQITAFYDVHQGLTDYFAALGVDYRVMINPDKHSVYPQYLPLTRQLGKGPWELKQLMTPPGPDYTVRMLDVSDALISAAASGVQQYYRTDSHWNLEGGWTAYQAMMDQLLPDHPNMRRLTEEDVRHVPVRESGDLAALIGQQGILEYDTTDVELKENHVADDKYGDSVITEVFTNPDLPDGPKVLMIGDSFRTALNPFLAASVAQLDLVMNDNPSVSSIGDLSRYDIVIFEAVERNRFWLWGGLSLTGDDTENPDEDFAEDEDFAGNEYGVPEDDEDY